jgi:hypothetical protein
MDAINRALFGLPPDEFAAMIVAELRRSGAARVVDGWLLPAAK